MNIIRKHLCFSSLILSIITLFFCHASLADPSNRVARLSDMKGAITFSPASVEQWAYAKLNRPFTTGDRIWADKDSRAEFQIGTATLRIGANTSLTIVQLNDKTAQFQLTQGTLQYRVRKIKPGQVYEVDAPNLALSITQVGDYRLDVSADGQSTTVSVRQGKALANGKDSSFDVDAPQTCHFTGMDLSNHQCSALAAADDFDQWCAQRDDLVDRSTSSKYVSDEVIGREDLDNHGSWRNTPDYGNVWVPNDVPADWAPYHYGQWVWINPWGWTWVDDQPWGFAPFHYGRWVYYEGIWSWVPGPVVLQPVYAPALVAFIGGLSLALGIGWFPLAPGEVFIPAYYVSRLYFSNINRSNTLINNETINKVYENPKANLLYKNKMLPHAVMAVPMSAFTKSLPVNKAAIVVSKDLLAKAPISHIAAVAPAAESVIGGGKPANIMPPKLALTRTVLAKTPPPAPPIAFSKQQAGLAKNPGKPLEPQLIATLKAKIPAGASSIITTIKPSHLVAPVPHPPAAGKIPHPPATPSITGPTEPFKKHAPTELIAPPHSAEPRQPILEPRQVLPTREQAHPLNQRQKLQPWNIPHRHLRPQKVWPIEPCGQPGHPCGKKRVLKIKKEKL